MITISLCLSDIPKDKIKQAENGKKYINLILSERKETGKFGETHTLCISKTKEEREAGEATVYTGFGKEYRPHPATAKAIDSFPAADNTDDLPF